MTEPGSSLAESIAESLRAQILNGKYGPGERLPSERELAERLGANRGSVREALKKLEQLGMIAIRRGGGARVVPLENAGLGVLRHVLGVQRPSRDLVAQWLDVHDIVICGATRLAVERASIEEIAQAKALLRKLAAPSTTDEEVVALTDALTELIAIASRNVVLRMVRNGLIAVAKRHHESRKQLRPARKLLLATVREVEDALDARDAHAAERALAALFRHNRPLILDLVAGPQQDD